ncbi:hypothetical protein PBI_MINERVA_192 [Mycobacterium phage Minerva]|uniref:hypothetical protein n=1 Tax=Mycobacterium phage Minerva TaxID=1527513 RepID=UPI0004EF8BFB|nr:hypothetical protein VC71_gp231 [Mycobacterium phage Minerva]AIK69400.1 hypothetical protein PBI_MINERVA_192 [Mycobacterium phage Minerva]
MLERQGGLMKYPPRCSECNRVIYVGAATDNKWLCEYCQIIADFKGSGYAPSERVEL